MPGNDAASECNIKVVCRIRPQSEAEKKAGGSIVVKFPSNDTVIHSVSSHKHLGAFGEFLYAAEITKNNKKILFASFFKVFA